MSYCDETDILPKMTSETPTDIVPEESGKSAATEADRVMEDVPGPSTSNNSEEAKPKEKKKKDPKKLNKKIRSAERELLGLEKDRKRLMAKDYGLSDEDMKKAERNMNYIEKLERKILKHTEILSKYKEEYKVALSSRRDVLRQIHVGLDPNTGKGETSNYPPLDVELKKLINQDLVKRTTKARYTDLFYIPMEEDVEKLVDELHSKGTISIPEVEAGHEEKRAFIQKIVLLCARLVHGRRTQDFRSFIQDCTNADKEDDEDGKEKSEHETEKDEGEEEAVTVSEEKDEEEVVIADPAELDEELKKKLDANVPERERLNKEMEEKTEKLMKMVGPMSDEAGDDVFSTDDVELDDREEQEDWTSDSGEAKDGVGEEEKESEEEEEEGAASAEDGDSVLEDDSEAKTGEENDSEDDSDSDIQFVPETSPVTSVLIGKVPAKRSINRHTVSEGSHPIKSARLSTSPLEDKVVEEIPQLTDHVEIPDLICLDD